MPLEGLCVALCRMCFAHQDSTPVLCYAIRNRQLKLALIGYFVQAVIFPYVYLHCNICVFTTYITIRS